MTNEQRAHDLAILFLKYNVKPCEDENGKPNANSVDIFEEYIDLYNHFLKHINETFNQF